MLNLCISGLKIMSKRWYQGLPKAKFQTRRLRNFLEILISSIRKNCKFARSTSVKPHILTPFIAPSMAVVAVMRLSMASSHRAWRDITRLVVNRDPIRDTETTVSIKKANDNDRKELTD